MYQSQRLYLSSGLLVELSPLAIRVRDRYLIHVAVSREYTGGLRLAAENCPADLVIGTVEALWDYRTAGDREAFGGIMKAVKKVIDLVRRIPKAWPQILEALGLHDMEGSWLEKGRALGARLQELAKQGFRILKKVSGKLKDTFPVSLFFVPKQKMPSLTDLLHKIFGKAPWIDKALQKIHGGAEAVDRVLKKYVPTLSRAAYAAIFIYIWLNVWEISWDLPGLVAGFTGQISLAELLSSLPESALGLLFAQLGFGTFAALPVTLVLRIVYLVANNYLDWSHGKLIVRWDRLGVTDEPPLALALT